MEKKKMEWYRFNDDCLLLAKRIKESGKKFVNMYPLPKNGLFVAIKLQEYGINIPILDQWEMIGKNTLIVDDLIDSGATMAKFPKNKKAVLYVKNKDRNHKVDFCVWNFTTSNPWIQFPWESDDEMEKSIERQLQYIGEDTSRDGLAGTAKRVLKSWSHLYSGYAKNPKDHLKTFEKGSYDQMVLLKNIEFYSTCEHHLQPFFGSAHIAYIPRKKVIGISKLARILETFSRRLQIQERIGEQITDFLMKELGAKGAACVLEAKHFCMVARGVEKQNSVMVTSSLKGVFRKQEVRAEFLNLIGGKK